MKKENDDWKIVFRLPLHFFIHNNHKLQQNIHI